MSWPKHIRVGSNGCGVVVTGHARAWRVTIDGLRVHSTASKKDAMSVAQFLSRDGFSGQLIRGAVCLANSQARDLPDNGLAHSKEILEFFDEVENNRIAREESE